MALVYVSTPEQAEAIVDAAKSRIIGLPDSGRVYVQRLEPKELSRLFVSNLPIGIDSEGVREIFALYVGIEWVSVLQSEEGSKGAAFVYVSTPEQAEAIVDAAGGRGIILPDFAVQTSLTLHSEEYLKFLKIVYQQSK